METVLNVFGRAPQAFQSGRRGARFSIHTERINNYKIELHVALVTVFSKTGAALIPIKKFNHVKIRFQVFASKCDQNLTNKSMFSSYLF